MIRFAGVVVFYNPPDDVIENINSYLKQIEVLFVIDNSENQNHITIDKIKNLGNIYYHWNGDNLGIAKALNIAATLALEQQYDFLLMMDQDSVASDNLIKESVKYLSHRPANDIGILYACHVYENYEKQKESVPFREILVADTSGSLLNLKAYDRIGGFLEKLFIDYVDYEYCLRFRSNGYKVIQLNNATLYQRLGDLVSNKFLLWNFSVTNHSPTRVYYRVRNRLYVSSRFIKKYPRWSLGQILYLWIDLAKIIFYENHKKEKCKMAFKGVWHWLVNKYGKYPE